MPENNYRSFIHIRAPYSRHSPRERKKPSAPTPRIDIHQATKSPREALESRVDPKFSISEAPAREGSSHSAAVRLRRRRENPRRTCLSPPGIFELHASSCHMNPGRSVEFRFQRTETESSATARFRKTIHTGARFARAACLPVDRFPRPLCKLVPMICSHARAPPDSLSGDLPGTLSAVERKS